MRRRMMHIRTDNYRLSYYIQEAGLMLLGGDSDPEVRDIVYDSRKAVEGSLFVAIKGMTADGHNYIKDACNRGCRMVVVSRDRVNEYMFLLEEGVTLLASDNTRRVLSLMSAIFFNYPSRRLDVIGVTGTNGKTSITYMLESIMKMGGKVPGVVGTVNYRWKKLEKPAPNTTPESRELHGLLSEMLEDGVDTVIMEVSSHALALNRVDDIDFDIGVFTNLTGDHLDFHNDMEDYYYAKARLFDLVAKSGGWAVINGDDEYGRRLLESADKQGFRVISFGEGKDRHIRPQEGSIRNRMEGLQYTICFGQDCHELSLNVAGRFHVLNSLAAASAADRLGIDHNHIVEGLEALRRVPGRFDLVKGQGGYGVIVDYAHTGDALQKLLESATELEHNRVITVFGCGGDRDKLKRPVMGRIAGGLSDMAIVTSDNPRTEEPDAIIADILEGMAGIAYVIEPDREKAIEKAISEAEEGDIIVIAGKGHEDYQILGREKIHFDDREIALKYMERKG